MNFEILPTLNGVEELVESKHTTEVVPFFFSKQKDPEMTDTKVFYLHKNKITTFRNNFPFIRAFSSS